MRGEVCIGFATVLSFVALLLLIFVQLGQTNTSALPRSISMVKVNVSRFGQGLQHASPSINSTTGLYTSNASAPLGAQAGLRQLYAFGLYSYCAYTETNAGTCTATAVAAGYKPFDAITADIPSTFVSAVDTAVPNDEFRDSTLLGASSRGAFYMLLLGMICACLAMLTGIIKHAFTFAHATLFALLGSVFVLVGAAIWTAVIMDSKSINGVTIGTAPTSLGIEVSAGTGLVIVWMAFMCLVLSAFPYMIICCTYRG